MTPCAQTVPLEAIVGLMFFGAIVVFAYVIIDARAERKVARERAAASRLAYLRGRDYDQP